MVLPTVKPGDIKEVSRVASGKADLNKALLNKANSIAERTSVVLDISAKPYIKKDGSKSDSFYTVTAKTPEGKHCWDSVQLLTLANGKDTLLKPRK